MERLLVSWTYGLGLARLGSRCPAGKTRRRLAAELVVELAGIDKRIKAANKELTELVEATGSTLLERYGVGPSGAARLLGDIGDVRHGRAFARSAAWSGVRPQCGGSGN